MEEEIIIIIELLWCTAQLEHGAPPSAQGGALTFITNPLFPLPPPFLRLPFPFWLGSFSLVQERHAQTTGPLTPSLRGAGCLLVASVWLEVWLGSDLKRECEEATKLCYDATTEVADLQIPGWDELQEGWPGCAAIAYS